MVVPPVWLLAEMGLAAWGAWALWPLTSESGLSGAVYVYLNAAVAAGVLTVVWGIWVLALLAIRSPKYPANFIVWQSALIIWLIAHEAYILAVPEFQTSLRVVAFVIGEIAIGVFCIAIVRRAGAAAAPGDGAMAGPRPAPVSAVGQVFLAVLGFVVGGAAGFGLGLGFGALIAEVTDMSCFEGACGFFAFFVGVAGMLIGAISGGALAVYVARRRGRG